MRSKSRLARDFQSSDSGEVDPTPRIVRDDLGKRVAAVWAAENDAGVAVDVSGPDRPAFAVAAGSDRGCHLDCEHLRFIPLYDDATCKRLGYPVASRPARLRIFCAAYQLDDREALLPTVCQRIRVLYDTARVWGEAGRPGWRDVWHDTRGEQWLHGLRYVEAKRGEWERELAGGEELARLRQRSGMKP